MGVWLILLLSWGRVLKMDKGFVHIVGHQWMDFLFVVIPLPLDGEFTVFFAIPITQTLEELLHGV
jgi:hypothetical protein